MYFWITSISKICDNKLHFDITLVYRPYSFHNVHFLTRHHIDMPPNVMTLYKYSLNGETMSPEITFISCAAFLLVYLHVW